MQFSVQINMENDAFEADPIAEIERVLTGVIRSIGRSCDQQGGELEGSGKAFDSNGNSVGTWDIR